MPAKVGIFTLMYLLWSKDVHADCPHTIEQQCWTCTVPLAAKIESLTYLPFFFNSYYLLVPTIFDYDYKNDYRVSEMSPTPTCLIEILVDVGMTHLTIGIIQNFSLDQIINGQ